MEAKKTGDSCHCSNMQWQELLVEGINVMSINTKREHHAFETFIEAGEFYWFTEISHNGLYKIDKKTMMAEFVGCFEGEKDTNRLFLDIVRYKNILVFVPFKANAIAIYDIETNRFSKIEIKESFANKGLVSYNADCKCSFATVYNESVYIFPVTYPAIIKLNMESYQIEYLEKPILELRNWNIGKKGSYFRKGYKLNDSIVVWCNAICSLLRFDVLKESFEMCLQLEACDDYIEAVCGEKEYWLIPKTDGKVIRLSEDYEVIAKISLPKAKVTEGISYLQGVCMRKYLWVFPGVASQVVKICKENNSAEPSMEFNGNNPEQFQVERTDWKFFFAKKLDDKIVAFNNFSGELIFYDCKRELVEKYRILTNINIRESKETLFSALKLPNDNIDSLGMHLYEGSRAKVNDYVDALINWEEELKTQLYI